VDAAATPTDPGSSPAVGTSVAAGTNFGTTTDPDLQRKLETLTTRLDAAEQEIERLRKEREAEAEKPAEDQPKQPPTPKAGGVSNNEDGTLGFNKWTNGNFMGTRVTFAFADDNLLAGPADRSPQPGFNLADDRFFYEQLTQEKRGYETETQLVVYRRMPSYFKHLDVEAALVLEMQNWINEKTWKNETVIGDDGSYLKLNWSIKPRDYNGDHVSLTLFPMDSQRFLLGYTYTVTWGGERIFPNNSGQVPGMRLRYDWNVGTGRDSYVFAGAKTARLINLELNEPQTYYAGMGGFGIGFTKWLSWEVNGGYFQSGSFPPQGIDFPETGGQVVHSFGGSTRLSLHQGLPIGTSIDFRLFRYSPNATIYLTQPETYNNKIAWSAALEWTTLGQSRLEFEDPNRAKIVPAMAGAFLGKVRIKKTRINANFVYRDLDFITFNVPGYAPYQTFPASAQVRPEWFVAGGVDYYFQGPRLTPGVIFAYKRPATYTADDVTTVIREWDDKEILPSGAQALDILSGKLTLKWDVAPFFVVVSELRYTLDHNRTKYVRTSDVEAGAVRVFQDANVTNRLGFFLLAQARW